MIPGGALVLASGGARGITARCVVALARSYRWRFVLLGRTAIDAPLPEWARSVTDEAEAKRRLATALAPARPVEIQRRYEHLRARLEIEDTLAAVAAAGGSAEYMAADVAAPGLAERLAAVVAGRAVAGILHGAGVLADRRLEDKSGADFDRVLAPKVRGLRALLDAVDLDELRFVALFSSAAAYYGNAGQADYAIANEILNKTAYRLRERLPRCRVVAFGWGPWRGDAGMVTPALERLFEARGIELVPPEAGARVVVDALAPGAAPAPQLLVGSGLPAAAPAEPRPPARIRRRVSEATSPFLRDHVIGGRAVLPVTCAMAWIAEACEARHPGLHAVRLEDCRVLGGVVLDGGEEAELTLELAETGPLRLHAEVAGRTAAGRPRPHYRADVVLAPDRPDPPRVDEVAGAAGADGAELYRDGSLFHGPTFRGLRSVLRLGADGIDVECRLAEPARETQGRFRAGSVNPYVADVLFQGLVVWVRGILGAASLPLATERVDLYRPLEFDRDYTVSVAVRERAEHRVLADVTAVADGRAHLRLTGAEVTVSPALNERFAPAGVA